MIALFALVLAACGGESEMEHGGMNMPSQDIPADLDESLSKMTDDGAFMTEIQPAQDPVPINEILTWELHVDDTEGNPVEGANVTIKGNMPGHNHGFPTAPTVTESDEAGVYLVEGVKYQMSGWWEMMFDITADSTTDSVTFNLVLP